MSERLPDHLTPCEALGIRATGNPDGDPPPRRTDLFAPADRTGVADSGGYVVARAPVENMKGRILEARDGGEALTMIGRNPGKTAAAAAVIEELEREQVLAARLVRYLTDHGYLVFQEVRHLGRIADVVAVDTDGLTLVVEVKASAGIHLLEQAAFWKDSGTANRVAIAAPLPTTPRLRDHTIRLCREAGYGVFEIADNVVPLEAPAFFGLALNDWPITGAHQRKAPAGTKSGERVSTRSTTAELVLEFVKANPGVSYADVVAGARLPIGKGRQAEKRLGDMVRKGEIAGVRRSKRGGAWRLYAEGDPMVSGAR